MKKVPTTKRAVKAKVKQEVTHAAESLSDQALEFVSEVDYKKLAKNALKVAIPLVAMKMIHSKYKDSNKSKWEKNILPLFEEIKSKLKDM